MNSFPRILARLALGSWAICALLPLGPIAAAPAGSATPTPPSFAATEEQRAALQRLLESDDLTTIEGQVVDGAALRRLYQLRGYDLLWARHDDRFASLAAAFDAAAGDGLDLLAPLPDLRKLKGFGIVERDLLLSDSALRFATELAVGRVRPEQWEEDWAVAAPKFDAVAGLDRALATEKLAPWLAGLAPSDPRYLRLKAALARYRDLARQTAWRQIASGPTLKPGMIEDRVGKIRDRLVAEGDLPSDHIGDDSFDATLEEGVRAFQKRHGIVEDGAIGARTTAALNVSARLRVEQIALTLERWRSLPREFGKNYVFVNAAGESLEVFEDAVPVMTMKVVVGDPLHPTPVVQSRIAAVTFNPTWRVPTSIAKAEIAPKIKRDPHYLEKNQMVQKGAYVFEQLPGPKNPLGQLKFETPNKFDVYLHDTSTHTSFERVARALSHGCVRIENARGLAAYVLGDAKWNPDEIEKAIALAETQKAEVARRLRVHILYFTSFVDADGTIEFRDDIYGRDKRLREALQGSISIKTVSSKPRSGVI
jgi:murein L,D-transpeptidase YcbB/YkuD